MSDLFDTARTIIERDARLRFVVLTGFTAVLAIGFMVLLISDQVQASAL
ncbi:MAG TPA: hypothetical protein VIN34_10245 [Candidatus Limnocylindria bacterium]|jgi:hypothetical protein